MTRIIIAALTAAAAAAVPLSAPKAQASDIYLGQIIMGGWNFCPRGTMDAAGQLLPIANYSALFSLYGTMYGGDGRTTFGLPDLRGRAPIGQGHGPGLPSYAQGAKGGATAHTLTTAQMPNHSHTATGTPQAALAAVSTGDPGGMYPGTDARSNFYAGNGDGLTPMAAGSVQVTVGNAGGSQSFSTQDPFQALRYCVATVGIFPSRP
ncbi:phage tail protein [Rhodovulum sp. DZ06]|uniref:phage tail protein n=1 Tax=Rhodovulum sp. DZ06 TaxID=3425126 RepID=UPI003D34722F